jgi:hypothetical protein
MPGYGSRVFVVDPTPRSDLSRRPDLEERRSEIVDPGKWRVHRDEPNALPLDKAQYSIEGGPWRGPEEVLRIDMAIRDEMGIPHRGGRMVQPWVRGEGAKPGRTEVSLRFCFRVESIPQGPCHLVVEEPWRYEIKLNGQPIILDQDEGWWIDPAFKRIRIPPGSLMIGDNELTLQTEYGSGAGLESLYFTGEFGVRWDPGVAVIEELPRELSLGDWTEQGFPCYSGAITYSTQVPINRKEDEKVYLQLPGWQGVLAKLRLNGSPVGAIAWPPFEVDLTPGITEGLNRLEIEIVSSRRNLLGPLHLTEAYPIWTGAGQFTTSGDEWTEEYVKIPYGLMEAPVLSFRTER